MDWASRGQGEILPRAALPQSPDAPHGLLSAFGFGAQYPDPKNCFFDHVQSPVRSVQRAEVGAGGILRVQN